MKARDYQERSRGEIHRRWSQGDRAVLLVSPTGSGKTFTAVHSLPSERILWVAHRRELVFQARDALTANAGKSQVATVMAGEKPEPAKRIQVGSLDTLLSRGAPTDVDVVVIDEAHHVMADTYRSLVGQYPEARVLGLTATPERDDGRPLGDVFDSMVVAASYSELIERGDLVSVDVVRPTKRLRHELAMDPVDAWMRFARGMGTFGFFNTVEGAYDASDFFTLRAKARAEVIEARSASGWRDDAVEQFRKGRIDVLCSVYALAEGVDVPGAHVALSSRPFRFVGTMLQCFGRVMRPTHGKERAIVIDLTGATHEHGLPDEDREYSLSSDTPIKGPTNATNEGSTQERTPYPVAAVELEVATSGHEPSESLRELAWARPSSRTRISREDLRAIRLKHGKRAMEYVMDYRDGMGA